MDNIISFKNYGFRYREQAEPSLCDINLDIKKGEKVLVVGPSGSGKSTLASCLNGLNPSISEGEVFGELVIKGKDATKMNVFETSKVIGTVMQDPDKQFIGLTVGEDIAFKLENQCVSQAEMKERVSEIAKIVDVDSLLALAPYELSGGQKQRVTLAGVMVDDADILLFDEPLANLDPVAGQNAIELIDDIWKKRRNTIIIIEHRIEEVLHRDVDRIILIHEGKIALDMTPDELIASNKLNSFGIREPLYITAMRYFGCDISAEKNPSSLEKMDLSECKHKYKEWSLKNIDKAIKKEKNEVLSVENLSYSYNGKKTILNDISFSINKGDMVSIVGKNGAGKSTLLKLICGFYKQSAGTIKVSGEDIAELTIKERAERIGFVMQNPNQMISKTMIFEEVALGLQSRGMAESEIEKRVYDALKLCGLYEFRNWPISALSYGQKKRVTIASVLVLNPEIIILDEPTAAQDYKHYNEIMEFLVELKNKGVTVITITHDMYLMLEYSDKVIVISDGEKIGEGTSEEIISNDEVIKKGNLLSPSIYKLAQKLNIESPKDFIEDFINYDRKERLNNE